jgi:hypothetical protein
MVVGWLNKLKKLGGSIGGAFKTGGKFVAKTLKNPATRDLISKLTKYATGFDPSDVLEYGSEFLDDGIDFIDKGIDLISNNENNEDYNLSNHLDRMGKTFTNFSNSTKNLKNQISERLNKTTPNKSLSDLTKSLRSTSNKILGSKNKVSFDTGNSYNSLIKFNDERRPGINLTYGDIEDYDNDDTNYDYL